MNTPSLVGTTEQVPLPFFPRGRLQQPTRCVCLELVSVVSILSQTAARNEDLTSGTAFSGLGRPVRKYLQVFAGKCFTAFPSP